MTNIKLIQSDQEISDCYAVLVQLHEQLEQATMVEQFRRMESALGYKIAALTEDGTVKAVAGFHLGESFAWGKYLYVDDLVTDKVSRSKGHGAKLMSWVVDYAKEHGCEQLHLDTRVTRYATHKFYLNQGLYIGGYHLLRSLDDAP